MDWQELVEKRFEEWGFQTDWVWMSRHDLFLLAWKGREIHIHYVEQGREEASATMEAVRDSFIELLRYLRRLDKWENNFKGREIFFKWMAFAEISKQRREILRGAGVEPFPFRLEGWSGLN